MRRSVPQASKLLFVLSLLVAASATLAMKGHLARLEAAAAGGGDTETVVTAAASLDRGAVLRPDVVRLEAVPAGGVPPGAIRSMSRALGRTLAGAVAAGEVLTAARLAPPGGPVASLVPPG
ncbi:MAG: SAF domain-containing protein, partial [Actinomycetota bacterium]|nr:SAF domain-containing protein [Actinomycetota bacterium]